MGRAPAPKTRIQKHGKGHRYLLDGRPVQGVTTIIGNGIPKPALQNWAAKTTAEFVANTLTLRDDGSVDADRLMSALDRVNAAAPQWAQENLSTANGLPLLSIAKVLTGVRFRDRDQAGARGTEVHNIAEDLARGEEVEVPEHLTGHIDAYLQFLEDWEPANAMLELVVINRKRRYMGKLDMIAEFPGKVWASGPKEGEPVGRGLLDIKTAKSGIFPDVALQLEAYAHAETYLATSTEEEPMPEVDWVGAIHVRADGYDLYSFDRGPDGTGEQSFRIFLYAREIGQWLDRDKGVSATIKSDSLEPPIAYVEPEPQPDPITEESNE